MAGTLTKAGRYQIVSELGRGSMGVVYKGYDPIIGRTVAIKTMLVEGLSPAEFQEYKARFQREAQAAGVLAQPNVVTVFDFGEDNGVLYLALEYLEGKSLQQLVDEQGVLPVETIIPIFDQVCSALDHAHSHRIVHRDIKPANIMILTNGLVKVMDFGIAKMMSMGMTQAGQILGTPNYMSPEQVKGRSIDGRSDIFSLGVILYELVTGEKPFSGQNITTVIYKIVNENPISPRELDSTIPLGLTYVISKALAKNPDERYQTCRELAEDLKNYKKLSGTMAPSATVVVKVPPLPTAPAEPVAAAPAAKPAPAQPTTKPSAPTLGGARVLAPARPQPRGVSPVTWALVTLLILGGIGGGGYYLHLHKGLGIGTQEATPLTTPTTPPETTPGTETATPSQPPTSTEGTPATGGALPEAGVRTTPGTAPGEATSASREATSPSTKPTATGATTKPAATPKVGQLIVTANVEGAKISIDSRSQPDWVTPYTFREIPAGTHVVAISKEGYDDFRQSVSIEGDQTTTLRAQLSAPSGEINIVTIPPGAEVFIDGRPYGASPVRAIVSAGQHQYTVRLPGMQPFESTFTIKSGSIITRRVELGAGSTVATGIVEVRTIPPGATVYADGNPIGGQTPTSFRLPPGPHTLTITLSGHRPVRREINVPANGSIPVNENLSPTLQGRPD